MFGGSNQDRRKLILLTLIKYVLALLFPACVVLIHNFGLGYLGSAIIEIMFVFLVSNIACSFNKTFGWIFSVVLLGLINVEYAVLFWGNTYVSMIMLTNLDSIQDLSGKALLYGLTVAYVLADTFLPVTPLFTAKKQNVSVGLIAPVIIFVFISSGLYRYSAGYGAYSLLCDYSSIQKINLNAQEKTESGLFWRSGVADGIQKPSDLPEKPNVILIMMEGTSQNIIDDERNIMPNLAALEENSLYFDNYYNHTFATFMGIQGQLYSGYQKSNYDPNELVSLQKIFEYYGYETAFLNTEPGNTEFEDYLYDMNFDNYITDYDLRDGYAGTISDKTAYEFLFDTACSMDNGIPFFLMMYSFGTHASLDSTDMVYGDGQDPVLNKFYNLDCQIGTFLQRFENSSLADNTILIFTADHATYEESDFAAAFPNYTRVNTMLDQIPFCIYYKGLSAESIDASGRNSLCLAPTICDYLDMTCDNYFLGTSLFSTADPDDIFDSIFISLADIYSTKDGIIQEVSGDTKAAVEERLAQYYSLKSGNADN